MTTKPISGGCQCGAVRFRIAKLGEPSICHCRMCQKAFGSFYAPLVTAHELTWTRGAPKLFQSSNRVKRGFCAECGTPLTYDYGAEPGIAIGALDHPELAAPAVQVCVADKQPFVDVLADLPAHPNGVGSDEARFLATIKTYQHPDTDTEVWPPANAQTD
ncbi:GFA family protein [Pararhizobium sp. IMCC21322]|uniref:GFA family protein n=1 Tax=Pararhizobium sp. IMCC21322 TaxID=3067903 RepID=UPI00274161BF|nr:GFA family protein [Pararhizobium sp. IMCC21322]